MSINGVSEAIPAILSYSERHFQRIDKLYQASYLLEYMSSLMSLLPNETNLKEDDINEYNNPNMPLPQKSIIISW
jgi:U3 small nucleolar RNA-associated protein 13